MSAPPAPAIPELIPHWGTMCLLDRVVSWTDREIHCVAVSHASPRNPLLRNGVLSAVHLIEYGAQAMAVHGALVDGAARQGVLASARDVELHVGWVSRDAGPLDVRATRLVGDAKGQLYAFRVSCGERLLASGRVGVVFVAPDPASSSAG